METHFTDPLELLKQLDLTPEQVSFSKEASHDFHFKVPKAYAKKIKIGEPNDPLLQQIFPVQHESKQTPGFSKDPLAESDSVFQPGLLQKYDGRALLLVTPSCTINCRYCFRRHYPYHDKGHFQEQIKSNLRLIEQDHSITEVILSGGDPLSLSNARLTTLFKMLEAIPHLRRIRIHTRFPIAEPKRINNKLLELFSNTKKQLIMVLHINHAQEIGSDNQNILKKLHHQSIILLNQSVLLKGVNDNAEILQQLSESLIDNHIIPYYLHMLDKVQGSAHFEVTEQDALSIHHQLRDILPGYLLPRLVREVAGGKSKLPLEETGVQQLFTK
ncbi:MAG: EF-P beta-lysylation protein EpmB [Gammaproteobacteria bacterium]|nr:EF-P beta-lysylation protein EpmB [Gammaproteobacteria bacterium]